MLPAAPLTNSTVASELLLNVGRDHAGRVAADQLVLAAQDRAVNRVVRDQASVDPSGRSRRIRPICRSTGPSGLSPRVTFPSTSLARRLMFASDIPTPVCSRAGSSFAFACWTAEMSEDLICSRVFAVPFVIRTAFQKHVVYARRADLRRGMRVRDGPPELIRASMPDCFFNSAATSS